MKVARLGQIKIEFRWIKRLENDDVVALLSQMGEGFDNCFLITEQVGKDDNEGAPANRGSDLMEGFSQIRSATRRM